MLTSKEINNNWKNTERCKNCAIRHLVLFSDLQHIDFEKIFYPIIEITYEPDSIIYNQYNNMKFVYTICSGLVNLVQMLDNGEYRTVRLLGQGDLLGIESLHHHQADHTAIAMNRVIVCRIPHSVVKDLQDKTTRLHKALCARWQQTVSKADLWITQLSTGKIQSRVARLLILLQESQGESFNMPKRESIGNMLGVTTESVSKITAEFKRRGWLVKKENNLYFIRKNDLNHLC